MKQSFIISIFLLILCIIISQGTHIYLHSTIIEDFKFPNPFAMMTPPPTTAPPQNIPKFIANYISHVSTSNYLNNTQIQKIYTTVSYAVNTPSVTTASQLVSYLKVLKTQINASDVPALPQLSYFCVSLPNAIGNFYLPDDTVPVPYNKLHAKYPDIFPSSIPFTQIVILYINWQQSMFLFETNGPILDPRSSVFSDIINNYISQINNSINKLIRYYGA